MGTLTTEIIQTRAAAELRRANPGVSQGQPITQEMIVDSFRAARAALATNERNLSSTGDAVDINELEITHAAMVAAYREKFQPSVTPPRNSRSSGVEANPCLGGVSYG